MGKGVSAPTVDVSQAVQSFQNGAKAIADIYPQAIGPYSLGLTQSQLTQIDAITRGQQQADPYVTTGFDAMNEMRQFLGLTPLNHDVQFADAMKGSMDKISAGGFLQNPNVRPYFDQLQGISKQFQYTTDPTERAGLKTQIRDLSNRITSSLTSSIEDRKVYDAYRDAYMSYEGPTGSNAYGIVWDYNTGAGVPITDTNPYGKDIRESFRTSGQSAKNYLTPAAASLLPVDIKSVFGNKYSSWEDYYAKREAIRSDPNYINMGTLDAYVQQYRAEKDGQNHKIEYDDYGWAGVEASLNSAISDLNNNLTLMDKMVPDQLGRAWTSQEINDKLTNTPGYQTQLSSGLKALERTQAATGSVISGNAMIAATKYGQDLAANTYQAHLNNLANLAGIANPIAGQNTAMQPQIGAQLGARYSNEGQFRAGTIQAIGNAQQQAWNLSGQAQTQAALLQAQLQMQANMANSQMMGGMLGSIGQLAGGLFGI